MTVATKLNLAKRKRKPPARPERLTSRPTTQVPGNRGS